MNKCENDYPSKCENVATVYHWDCCGCYGGINVCVDCANEYYLGGDTQMCEWYNVIDNVVVASDDKEYIGTTYA